MFIQCHRVCKKSPHNATLSPAFGLFGCYVLLYAPLHAIDFTHFDTCFLLFLLSFDRLEGIHWPNIVSLHWCDLFFFCFSFGADCVIHRLAAASNENLCSICVKISVKPMFAQFDVIVFIGRFSKHCRRCLEIKANRVQGRNNWVWYRINYGGGFYRISQ